MIISLARSREFNVWLLIACVSETFMSILARAMNGVWIKDGRGRGLVDADWRTWTDGRGLTDADWRTRTGGRGLRAFQPHILTRNVRIFKLKHI